MSVSIFTRIIRGEIPCHKIYEDDLTLAFLDINPIQPGQVLVVPKRQVGFIWDMENKEYQALMSTVQKVGKRLRKVFPDKSRIGVMIEGLEVDDHAHVKVFPFTTEEEYRSRPIPSKKPSDEDLAKLAVKLAF